MEVIRLDLGSLHVVEDPWPVHGFAVLHPQLGAILVDTGCGGPEILIREYRVVNRSIAAALQAHGLSPADVRLIINTHLHFDHCGGNRKFAGTPTYVQRAELAAAVEPDYLVDWVHFDGESYVEVDGDAQLYDGVSVLFTPGHSPGHQVVVVDTADGVVVLGGDVTYSMRELIDGATPSILRVHQLRPRRVYLAHHERPWEPEYS